MGGKLVYNPDLDISIDTSIPNSLEAKENDNLSAEKLEIRAHSMRRRRNQFEL